MKDINEGFFRGPGFPFATTRPTARQLAAFWSRVDKKGPDECWNWTGLFNACGYGTIRYSKYCLLATRAAMWIQGEPIDSKRFVLHRCDNPACVNPRHLFLGTQLDNMRDMHDKGRAGKKSKAKKHWLIRIQEAFDSTKPVKLPPGDVASLWRVLNHEKITNPEIADTIAGRAISTPTI